jgi:N-acetylmuramoyl-L-alanine amidase
MAGRRGGHSRAARAVGLLAAPVLLAGSLAACGGGGDEASGGTTTTEPPPTTQHEPPEPPPPSSSTVPVTTTSSVPADTEPSGDAPVVVVDPGHNGANGEHPEIIQEPVDAGGFQKACNTTGSATSDGYTESEFNFAVAIQLRDRLTAAGIEVVLTRPDDAGVGPCVDERGQIAARSGAAALVSIHADGGPISASGFHIIHPGLRPGYTDDTMGPSAVLATMLCDGLVAAGFSPADYVGEDGLQERTDLGTLNRAEVPAVMLEAGNLRNPGDAATLRSPEGQQRLADALRDAVLAFVQP